MGRSGSLAKRPRRTPRSRHLVDLPALFFVRVSVSVCRNSPSTPPAQVLCWTLLYYVTSAGSGIWNKRLVDDDAVSPTVLTLLHLLVSLGSDIAIMRYNAREPAAATAAVGTSPKSLIAVSRLFWSALAH